MELISDRLGYEWESFIIRLPDWQRGDRNLLSHIVIQQAKMEANYSVQQQISKCLIKWAKNCCRLPGVVSKETIVKVLKELQRQDVVEEIEAMS
jgi:hypothetical protein